MRNPSCLALLCASTLIAPTQQIRDRSSTSEGTATIRGRVVAADTGEPIRKARVSLSAATPVVVNAVTTDSDGRFAFDGIPAGQYVVTAKKPGYATTRYGARRAASAPIPIDVADGAAVAGLEVRMPRGAAITGRIVDEFGDPIERAIVNAARLVASGTGSRTVLAATTTTDDLGEYRLGGLAAATYLVDATLANVFEMMTVMDSVTLSGRIESFRGQRGRAFYPGIASARQAQPIVLRAGDERANVDFAVVAGSRGKLTITFMDATGASVPGSATLISLDQGAGAIRVPAMGPSVSTDLDAGDWMVQALGFAGVGAARVSMPPSDITVPIVLAKGARVTGRLVAEGGALPRATVVVQARVTEAAGALASSGAVRPDGTFEVTNVIGRRELTVSSLPPGYALTSIVSNGRNLTGLPMDFAHGQELNDVQVTITTRVARLAGSVVDSERARTTDYTIVLVPDLPQTDEALRRAVRMRRPSQTGTFVLEDLTPGDYIVAAVDDIDESPWIPSDDLQRLRARGTKISLAANEMKTIVLDLITLR